MLVISRRIGEVFLIGDSIEIEILDMGTRQVKLGIRAPRSVTILRKEVQLTGRQNRAAAEQASIESLSGLVRAIAGPRTK